MQFTGHDEEFERPRENGLDTHNTHNNTHTNNNNNNNNNNNQFNNAQYFLVNISRLLGRSTIHGLSHISTSSNNFSRFIWFILWLSGVAGFLINLSFIVEHYLSRPVLTSYINDYEDFLWPDIIFCNPMAPYNVYTDDKKELWNYYVNWARNISVNIPNDLFVSIEELDVNEIIVQSLVHSTLPYWRFNVGNVNDMFQFIAGDNGHQGIRLSIELDENLIMLPLPLKNYFYTQILQKRYNVPCFNFQITRNLNVSQYKRIKKLAFGIKFNYQSYLIINSSYTSHMIDLYITLPNHFPYMDVIQLTPGYINHIQLEMLHIQRIKDNQKCSDKAYSAIIYDGDLITKRLIYGTSELCHRILSQYLYYNQCHCYSPYLPYAYFPNLLNTLNNQSILPPNLCLNMSIFNQYELVKNSNCMYHVYQKYTNRSEYMQLNEAKQCDYYYNYPYCNEIVYNKLGIHRITMTELWSNTYNDARVNFLIKSFHDVFNEIIYTNTNQLMLIQQYNNEILNKMRNNFGLLTIERVHQQGRLIREEYEYSLAQLLSDIGGNMGLWIGISVIGLFEFIELFTYILYASFNYMIKIIQKN